MSVQPPGLTQLVFLLVVLLFNSASSPAPEWRTVALPSRVLNIVESGGNLWVCGADELIAVSADSGKTWTTKHNVANGALLLSIGFADKQFGYAAGTGGAIFITGDSGETWTPVIVPSQIVYQASFSNSKQGIIHTPHTIYATIDGGAHWNPVLIDLSSDELKGFSYVLTVQAANADHMAIVLSKGNSSAHAYKLLLSKDKGSTWSASDIPSTGLKQLFARDGEYWFTGMEVIEKDKPGGGYGVPPSATLVES